MSKDSLAEQSIPRPLFETAKFTVSPEKVNQFRAKIAAKGKGIPPRESERISRAQAILDVVLAYSIAAGRNPEEVCRRVLSLAVGPENPEKAALEVLVPKTHLQSEHYRPPREPVLPFPPLAAVNFLTSFSQFKGTFTLITWLGCHNLTRARENDATFTREVADYLQLFFASCCVLLDKGGMILVTSQSDPEIHRFQKASKANGGVEPLFSFQMEPQKSSVRTANVMEMIPPEFGCPTKPTCLWDKFSIVFQKTGPLTAASDSANL